MQFDTSDTPTIKRRLTVLLYETLLLFAITFVTTLVALLSFSAISESPDTPIVHIALRCCLFLIIGAYFCWHWCRTGQTLPMKTWRLRLVTQSGLPVPVKRAMARYILGWLWLLPGLAIAWTTGATGWTTFGLVLANIAAWALTAKIHPSRQFLHDRIAGTKLIEISKSK